MAFDVKSITDGLPYILPPGHGVVRVLNPTALTHDVLDALQTFRKNGYLVSIDLIPGSVDGNFCVHTDILSRDFVTARTIELIQQVAKTRAKLLARGVQTIGQFEKAREMGFNLFQGSFFKESQPVPGKKLSSSHISRINLFQLVESRDPDLKVLAMAISSDVAISFRLLLYLNSPLLGLIRKIQSIDQAIILLGWDKLKIWLRAVLMADLAEKLPLDPKLKSALRQDTKSEYLQLFHLLSCLEDGDWDVLEKQVQQLGMELNLVKTFHAQSREWAEAFFSIQMSP